MYCACRIGILVACIIVVLTELSSYASNVASDVTLFSLSLPRVSRHCQRGILDLRFSRSLHGLSDRLTMPVARAALVSIVLVTVCLVNVLACGPGRGSSHRRARRKMTPLVFKQHVPNVSENTLGASGPAEGSISRSDQRFNDLVVNNNPDIDFKNRRSTNNDRIMSQVS